MAVNFNTFINKHKVYGNVPYTHVLLYPHGKLNISNDQLHEFYHIYANQIDKQILHIAETQPDNSQLILDIDFVQGTTTRQYTNQDIMKIVSVTNEIIKDNYDFNDNLINAFVLEKDKVMPKDDYFKDGIHIMYPDIILSRNNRKIIIRKVSEEIKNIKLFDKYNFLNEDIFDEHIVYSPWLMYGSSKQGNIPYKLSYVIAHDLELIDMGYTIEELVKILSMHRSSDMMNNMEKDIYKEKVINEENYTEDRNDDEQVDLARKLVSLLPIKYAESYHLWTTICWALKSTGDLLFSTFIEFSKRAPKKYYYDECKKLWDLADPHGKFTIKTLMYYAKLERPVEFAELMEKFDYLK